MLFKITSFITLAALLLPSAMVSGFDPREISKELKKARKNGASREELLALKKDLHEKLMTARAGGVSLKTIKDATDKGADMNDIKAHINKKNLQKYKKRGVFKKKEKTLSSILFPGASPEEYRIGDPLDIVQDTVDSSVTGLPLLYYRLPVCKPDTTRMKGRKRKNLGERLAGKSVAEHSPYPLKVLQNKQCTSLCTVNFSAKDIKRMTKLVKKQYRVKMILDGLPLQVQKSLSGTVSRGYPIGARLVNEATSEMDFYLHNHVNLQIQYNRDEAQDGYVRIVGFNAVPVSINHDPRNLDATCNDKPTVNRRETLLELSTTVANSDSTVMKLSSIPVTYSYGVEWIETDLPWTDRWDIYILGQTDDSGAHHMSIVNSVMVVMFLGCVVAVILIRALRKDIAVYNDIEVDLEDDKEETGWKMIHGDVFRPPSTKPMALAVLVGTGCQLAFSVLLTLIMSQTNMLNPMMKGKTVSNIIMFYVFSGTIAGYVSARIFKFTGGKNWKLCTIYTAGAFPGVLISMFLCLNIFLTLYGSAKRVAFFTIFLAFFLWICVASPLVFLGSFLGFKRDVMEVPTRTNQIARVVPPYNPFLDNNLCSLAIGIMPFSTICIEIYFLMGAIWLHQYYFLMGYLLVITIVVGVICALLSMVMCYIRLCSEDHRWWWKSFCDTATCGVWFFLYSIWFVVMRMNLTGVLPIIVYFTYMAMMSLAAGLYCGSVSFLSTLWFVKTIYRSVKLD